MDKSSIGEMLREGRLRQRLSIAECAKRTHIAQRFIEALEEEQWDVLPSESHRQGFLRLYCRFLGVPSEDVLVLYRHGKPTSPTPQKEPLAHPVHPLAPERSWGISSWQQLVALIILVLVLAWAVYHAFWRSLAGSNVPPYSWARLRPHHPRLTGRGHEAPVQRIRIVSRNSSWLRVEEGGRLIYEGLLPGGLTKDWSGAEPFVIKVGDIQAVSVFWNDQPVDLAMGARGNVNELKLPPPK
jgi:transcriptional regulator with XRE-family HTH domain